MQENKLQYFSLIKKLKLDHSMHIELILCLSHCLMSLLEQNKIISIKKIKMEFLSFCIKFVHFMIIGYPL